MSYIHSKVLENFGMNVIFLIFDIIKRKETGINPVSDHFHHSNKKIRDPYHSDKVF